MSDEHPLASFKPEKQQTLVAKPQIASARISPDGRWLVGGGFDGLVRRWDLAQEAPAELPALPGHHGWIEGLAMHADLLLTADSWGRLRAWSLAEEPALRWEQAEAHDGWIRQLAVSPDGSRVASCGRDGRLATWSLDDGARLDQWDAGEDAYCLVWRADDELYSGDSRGSIRQWKPRADQAVRTLDASALYKYDRIQDVGGVKVMAIDAPRNILVAAGVVPDRGATVQGEPTVMAFDLEAGKLLRTVSLGASKDCYVHDLQRHPAGFWMAVTCGTPGTGQLVFFRDEEQTPFYRDTKIANCHSLCYHEGQQRLAVTSTNKGSNGNGRRLNKDGEYEGNSSPVDLFLLARAAS